MRRRAFLNVLAVVTTVIAARAHSQSTTVARWRIAFLSASTREGIADEYDSLIAALRDLGYVQGSNVSVVSRFANGQYEQLPKLAAELVALNPHVIVAAPSPAIRAAQRATSTIPIVFPSTGDPVGSGFVTSLARPGGNITGLSNSDVDLAPKTLELLKATLPHLSTVGLLANPGSSSEQAITGSISAAAKALDLRMVRVVASSAAEINQGFLTFTRERVEAVVIGNDALMGLQKYQIAELGIKHHVATVSQGPGFARAGCLLGYGVDRTANYRRAATYVDRILRGAKPAELPVEQATKFQLIVNARTAKTLNIAIPASVMARADEVIE